MAGICVALKRCGQVWPPPPPTIIRPPSWDARVIPNSAKEASKQGTLGPLLLFKLDDFLSVMAKCKNLPTRWLSSSPRRRRRRNHRSLRHRR